MLNYIAKLKKKNLTRVIEREIGSFKKCPFKIYFHFKTERILQKSTFTYTRYKYVLYAYILLKCINKNLNKRINSNSQDFF